MLFFCVPGIVKADGIHYSYMIDQSGDYFSMRYGNTQDPDYYICSVSTLFCTDNGKIVPVLPKTETVGIAPKFVFSTSQSWKNTLNHRIFYLKNRITGKVYTRSYSDHFVDTLYDSTNIYSFSSDWKTLIYQDDSSGYPVLYKVDLTKLKGNTFRGVKLFPDTFSVNGFMLTSPTNLYFIGNKDGPYAWNLYRYDLQKNTYTLIANNVSYAARIRKFDNGITFLSIEGASSFPEYYNELTGVVSRFSGLPGDDLISNIKSSVLSFGGKLTGVLMVSNNFDKKISHPFLIWLHGGPYRQTSFGFQPYTGYAVYDLMLNQLAENGVIVLKLDYRGSYGYGANFADSIKYNVGKGDVSDVLAAVNYINKNMSVSDTYVMGNSYGGYLALRTIVEKPEDFKGAISINGVTDWASLLVPLRNSIFNVDFGGLPNKNTAKYYMQSSILSRVGNLTNQKITIIQSRSDRTIFPSQASMLLNLLKEKGKNVDFYPYTDADHVFTKTSDLNGVCANVFNALSLPLGNNCVFE